MIDIAHIDASGPRGWRAVYVPIGIILLSLGLLIILPTFLVPRLGIPIDLRGRTLVALGGTLLAELILFGFLLRWLKGQARTLTDIGWARPTTLTAILVGLVFAIGYSAFTFTNPLIGQNAAELSLFKLAGVAVGVVGAIVEECVFRGYVITELERIKVTIPAQILVSGVAFAVIHVGFDLAGMVITLVMGLVLATVYIIGKRSLTPSIISHVAINVLVEPWLLLFIITMYSRLGHG